MQKTKNSQISLPADLHVWRVGQGIQLTASDDPPSENEGHIVHDTGATVGSLLQLSVSTWFLDHEGATLAINEEGAEVCGFKSPEAATGRSLRDVSRPESASRLIGNCREVVNSGEIRIYEECNIRMDGSQQQFLSVKSPLYDQQQHLMGVCGFSIVLGRHPLAESLSLLSKLGFLGAIATPVVAKISSSDPLDKWQLPPREKQCLAFILRGYTAKMIARELQISFRTVESYLVTLKKRLGACSRSDLITIASS